MGNLTGPLPLPERKKTVQGSKHSRPGPSYWKTAFLAFFPAWAQEAYWDLIDTQRKCRIISSSLKNATQVHLDKPSGGFRPLTMLEESFKAIEGPPARRKAWKRSEWDVGVSTHSTSRAKSINVPHLRFCVLTPLYVKTPYCSTCRSSVPPRITKNSSTPSKPQRAKPSKNASVSLDLHLSSRLRRSLAYPSPLEQGGDLRAP